MKTSMLLLFLGSALFAGERFDLVVRNDFFAGFAGDKAAFARAMKASEAALAANPKDAQAMVWHGGGVFFESGEAAKAGDYPKAVELYERGLDEMDGAVRLAPTDVAVLIPRGAILLAASHNVPGDSGKQLLQIGLGDYEKAYEVQESYFDTLSGHARGELLFGIAEAYHRLGDDSKARPWFTKLAAVADPENGHLRQARTFLESGNLTGTATCAGCHVSK